MQYKIHFSIYVLRVHFSMYVFCVEKVNVRLKLTSVGDPSFGTNLPLTSQVQIIEHILILLY